MHGRTAMAMALLPLFLLQPKRTSAQSPRPDTIGQRWTYDGLTGPYVAEVAATGLRVPFGLAFLPDGRALLSDRPTGRLALLDLRSGRVTALEGGPAVYDSIDAGMLDVVVHPDYARNGWVFYAFAERTDSGKTTVVERAQVRGSRLVDRQRLFAAYPAVATDFHFGARLALRDGYLFIGLGERHMQDLAQELWTDHGKIVRLFDDGRVPRDNPFVGRAGARPEIWSLGHRNPHGLAFHPTTGDLWESEHGPLGGDEVNVIRRGANYGWPEVTFGREYSGGFVGDGRTEAPGMEPPIHHYASSAALSGLAFYTGAAFPAWRGNLFMGAMTPRYLARLIITPGAPPREERMLLEQRWRVRVVQQGPDGFLYLGIERTHPSLDDGMIVRLRPGP
ncbi:MAG: PQQ-dependent sugar dehydrogenase [Gemmatimonadetes bacterium]|nr:PQQ-dependent sugar dehydrogenase [Gemmatimonadota bacterium]